MKTLILACLVLVIGCGDPPTTVVVEDDTLLDWPVREWRDTVVIYDPETGENLP